MLQINLTTLISPVLPFHEEVNGDMVYKVQGTRGKPWV